MLAAFVSAGASPAAPLAPSHQAAGLRGAAAGPSAAGPSPTLTLGAPLAVAAAGALAVRGQKRKQRAGRVAVADGTSAGWKPDPERIGATLPLADPEVGILMWDPAGFCNDGSTATFDKFREAEIKHGRVAMLAVIGLIVQHYVHIKGFVTPSGIIAMDDMPNGLGALTQAPGGEGFGILVLLAGIIELGVLKAPEGSKPWEFGDPLGLRKVMVDMDDATLKTYEIEHGRLAMLGFIGTIMAEAFTGYDAVQQWEYWRYSLSSFNAILY